MNTYYLCHLSEFIAGEMDNRRQQKKLEIYYGKEKAKWDLVSISLSLAFS